MIDIFDGDFDFLSNFSLAEVELDGRKYPTVEHAYQAAKTFDQEWRERIQSASTPGRAKRLGRKVPLHPDWEEIKTSVMLQLLRQKFSDPELNKRLLDTGDQYLAEGNTWHDNFWGICRCGRCHDGQNKLGELLMQVRDELRSSH